MIVKRTKREPKDEGTTSEDTTGKVEKKTSKFQELRKKYLKKQTNQKPTEPVSVECSSIVKMQVPVVVPQPKKELELPAQTPQYLTNFKEIIGELQPRPIIRTSQSVQKQSPFVLNGVYEKTIPINLAKRNMLTPDPPVEPPKQSIEVEPYKENLQIQHSTIKQKTNYKLLIGTHNQYCNELHQKGYADEALYSLIKLRIFNIKTEKTDNPNIHYASRNLNLQPWTKKLFEKFLVQTPDIPTDHHQIAYDFLTEFFPPVNSIPDIVVIVISKLSATFWKIHEQQLVSNSQKYLEVLRKFSKYISQSKKSEFCQYILKNLNHYVKLQQYCIAFLKIVYEFPNLLKDQQIVEFNNQCKSFEYAAILYLLINNRQEKLVGKGVTGNTMTIVRYLEEEGCFQQCLGVLDNASHTSGQSAYSVMREVRLRIVGKLEQKESEARKGSKGSLFTLFNQAIGVITNPKSNQDSNAVAVQQVKEPTKMMAKDTRKQ